LLAVSACGAFANEGATPTPGNQDPTQQENEHSHHDIPQYYQPPDPQLVKDALTKLFDEKLDQNKDNYVDAGEMKNWLKVIHSSMIEDNIDKQWEYFKETLQSESLPWDEYRKVTFPEADLDTKNDDGSTAREQLSRTERRWKHADDNADGLLSKVEFKTFLHPEEDPKKSDIVVTEAIEMMDKTGDGTVTLDEYMDHLKSVAGPEKDDDAWLKEQQAHFTTYLDKNKDGQLDTPEMKEWVIPTVDREEGEAWRFISFADQDRDTKLTRTDIIQNHEHFMGLLPAEFWHDNAHKHDGQQLNEKQEL